MRIDEAYDQGDLLLYHICEVCNKVELLTSKEGFYLGWDYPPRLGVFGIISPRTCADYEVENTLWFQVEVLNIPIEQLSLRYRQTMQRILEEPESTLPCDEDL